MRWFLFLPFSLTATLVCMMLCPIFALFAKDDAYPRWLWWATTHDCPARGDDYLIPFPGVIYGIKGYWNRVWYMFRNPAYNLDLEVFAYKGDDPMQVWGNRPVSGNLNINGWFFARQGWAWQLYITHHWSLTHTTKINIGWKLWPGRTHQFVFSPFGFWKRIS